MEILETVKYKGYEIEIVADDWAESPREWDNVGKMVCNNRNYNLGDEQYKNSYANSWREWFAYYVQENYSTGLNLKSYDTYGYFDDEGKEVDRIWKWIENNMIVFKLWIYDHSGITINHSSIDSANRGWDNSNVGFHYVTRERAIKEWGNKKFTKAVEEKAIACLEAELETYDDYVSGNVYGYRILDKEGDMIDSCYGFFGYDHEKSGLLNEAMSTVDYIEKSKIQEHFKKLKKYILSKVPFIYREELRLI